MFKLTIEKPYEDAEVFHDTSVKEEVFKNVLAVDWSELCQTSTKGDGQLAGFKLVKNDESRWLHLAASYPAGETMSGIWGHMSNSRPIVYSFNSESGPSNVKSIIEKFMIGDNEALKSLSKKVTP